MLAAGLGLAACTESRFTRSPGAPDLAPYKGEVRVLDDFPRAERFRRLGVVVVSGPDSVDDERLREQAKEDAARRGANAVIYQGAVKVVPYEDGHFQKRLAAFAIRLPP